jgi:hypothetical protein
MTTLLLFLMMKGGGGFIRLPLGTIYQQMSVFVKQLKTFYGPLRRFQMLKILPFTSLSNKILKI